MNNILDFLIQHWQLSGVLLLLVAAYAIFEFMQKQSNDAVSAEQAVQLINHQNAVVIDVRSPSEFKTGHILGALNFDSAEFDNKIKQLNKYAHKPVVVVCAMGKRSANCLKLLQQQKFTNAVTLNGGLRAWQDAGFPLTTDSSHKEKG